MYVAGLYHLCSHLIWNVRTRTHTVLRGHRWAFGVLYNFGSYQFWGEHTPAKWGSLYSRILAVTGKLTGLSHYKLTSTFHIFTRDRPNVKNTATASKPKPNFERPLIFTRFALLYGQICGKMFHCCHSHFVFSHKILNITPVHISMTTGLPMIASSQHTLYTLYHSHRTTFITQSHTSLLPTCLTSSLEPASYITQDSSSKLFIPLSATIIWTCRFNLLHTAITFHHFFTLSLKLTFSENSFLLLFVHSLFMFVGLISQL